MPVLGIAAVDLVALIVALAAILVLFAAWIPIKVITVLLQHVPFIGGSISSSVANWLLQEMKGLAGDMRSLVRPVAHLFVALGPGLWGLVAQTVKTLSYLSVVATFLNHLINTNKTATDGAITQLQGDIPRTLQEAKDYANTQAGLAESQAMAVAAQGLAGVEADLHNAEDMLNGAIDNLATGSAADLQGAINALEAQLGTVQTDVSSLANQLFGEAEAGITGLQDQVLGIPAEILGTVDQVVPGVVAGAIAGAIPGILSQVIPRVAALEAEATTCLEPLCDTVTPNASQLGNLGNLLKGLDGLFDLALLGALLTAAVEDPAGTATAVVDVTSWLTTLGVEAADAAGVAL